MKKLISILVLLAMCISMFAACTNPNGAEGEDITAAGDYLFGIYKDDKTETPNDYEVAGVVKVGNVSYTVTWTVDVTAGVTVKKGETESVVLIDVDEKTETEIAYVLTATITAPSGASVQKTFNRKVPAYKQFSYADYVAAEDDTPVAVTGIVTGIFSKSNGSSANGLYIQDLNNEGGYYVYGTKDSKDPSADLGIKVGMTVEASGVKDTYSGMYEVIDAAITVVDSTVKTVTPVDYTEAFKNATTLNDSALVDRQAMLITIKGVEITGQDVSNGYFKFKLGELETYLRLSSSNNCITAEEKETFKTAHTDHFGYTADVTGIVSLYNGNLYLIPATVDAFTNFALPQRTDDEKIEMEVGNITIADRITVDTEIQLPLTGSTYTEVKLAWTSDNACAVIDAATGKLTITLPDADATVTLTLQVTCGEKSVTKTYTVLVNSASTDVYVPENVTEVKVDTAYKFALYQTNLGKYFYFAGYMSGNFLATTDKGDKAVDVYLETVEGGFRIYFKDGETKKYIDVYEYTAGKVGVQITDKPTCTYTYNKDLGIWVANVAGDDYYLGTYKTFDTISASKTSYINAENKGVSQFPCDMATLAPATYVPENVTDQKADTAYKFSLYQTNLGKYLYFAGYMSGNYLATTDKADKATDVYLETVDGGFRIYFKDGETKKYIDVYEYTAGKVGVQITDKPTCTYTYNKDLGIWVANVAGADYYLGTYKTFDTISASKTSYINAENKGVSQFPCDMSTVSVVKVAPVAPETPAADTAYKFALHQTNLGKDLYFAGYMSGNYLATTDKISKAVDVYLETVDGGFRIYFMDGETKKYIDVYEYTAGKVGVQITDKPTCTYTYNKDLGTWVANVAGADYYLGTYKTFDTISASSTSYINAENKGVSQFPAGVVLIQVVEE